MFDPFPLEVKIYNRLAAIARGLEQAGIPIIFLPKEAQNYDDASSGAIQVIIAKEDSEQELSPFRIPSVDVDPTEDYVVVISQEIVIHVKIIFSLPKRYANQENEQGVLGGVASQISKRLLGFSPFENIEEMKLPLHFRDFELLQPEGGQWKAVLMMACMGTIETPREVFVEETVQLVGFATDRSFNTAIATEFIKFDRNNDKPTRTRIE